EEARALAGRVRCPVLVIHGDRDAIASVTRGAAMAEQTGGDLVVLEGSGHAPHIRDPVKVNLLLRDFVEPPRSAPRWARGKSRRRRALNPPPPRGRGHARRDVGVEDDPRTPPPAPETDRPPQPPAPSARGGGGAPPPRGGAPPANESRHIESECAEHD